MADTKISDLTALTSLATDDELVVVDTSETETKRITKTNLASTIGDGGIDITIADTINEIGATVIQNDTTNNPDAVSITNTADSNALTITQSGDVGNTRASSGGLFINNTGNPASAMRIYTNEGATSSNPLMALEVDNTAFDQTVLKITSDGTGSQGLIRLDSPAPEIEFVETDQAAPAGKFEIRVQNDMFQLNGRNVGDNAFENSISFERLADGGRMGLGGDGSPDAMIDINRPNSEEWLFIGNSDGDVLSVNTSGVLTLGDYVGANGTFGKIQVNSNATSPSSIDLANTINVGTGTGGANATNKFLGQFGWLSRDSSFTAPKLVAYIGAEATETYAADADTGSDIVFYTGTDDGTNPTEKFRVSGNGTPLTATQAVVTETNFKKYIALDSSTIWVSDGTTAEGALTGVEGDMCLNGGTGAGQAAYCDANGTNWTDM